MSYVKNLDGVRSLAILLVLVFHIDHYLVPGGFVGVDVFFAISGYIITRNSMASIDNKKFSLTDFYLKRFTRLFPAALVVSILTLLTGMFLVGPEDLRNYGRTAIYSALAVVNIFFNFEADYFADDLASNPYLHNWSLSVEEQFYLVWPSLLLLMAGLKLQSRLAVISILFIVGSAVSYFAFAKFPSTAFYEMPFRVFQFAIGAAFGLLHINRFKGDSAAMLAGFAMVMASALLADGADYEFLIAAFLPAVGSGLIFLGINSTLSSAVFGNPVSRFIGLRAYSIYLVHWPLIVFVNIMFGSQRSLPEVLGMTLLSIALGTILYYAVENPLRFARRDSIRVRSTKVFITGLMLVGTIVFSAHLWAGDSNSSPINPPTGAQTSANADSRLNNRPATTCLLGEGETLEDYDFPRCTNEAGSPDILLIGDSWSTGTYNAMLSSVPIERIARLGAMGCRPLPPVLNTRGVPNYCVEMRERQYAEIFSSEYDFISITSNWQHWNEEEIRTAFEILNSTDKRVTVFSHRPFFSDRVPAIVNSAAGERSADDLSNWLERGNAEKEEILRQVMLDFPNFSYVNFYDTLCDPECKAFTPSGNLIYVDRGHLTLGGAQWLGQVHAVQVREAFSD